ncbi:MAG TPA: fructose-6-phosphate aldolase [Patescibacteria group bacterium]|jgi:transaldolase|nr:fructose-6-phosphate aldolase [Patescibacteria group bacterium]
MKFFLDTGSVDEIRQAAATGILDGVTTNPSLVAKEGKKFKDLLLEICSIVDGPVSAEVTATDTAGMIKQAMELREIHKNIVVKLPLLKEGITALSQLSPKGVKVNVTLCFSASQALIAAKAGATYISPFIGRLDDISQVGMDLIREIRVIYDNYDFKTQILTASVRHPVHVVEAAMVGSDVATMPLKVFEALFRHPLTDIGNEKFLADWKKLKA